VVYSVPGAVHDLFGPAASLIHRASGKEYSSAIIYLTQPLRCYAKFMIVIQPNPLQEPRHPPIRGCGGTARRK
jgi:hypothetical protein